MKTRLTIAILFLFSVSLIAQQTLTPELLWKLKRVYGMQISPDGANVMYGVSDYDLEANNGKRSLYIKPVNGGKARMISKPGNSIYDELWRPDGKKIGFLAEAESGMQWFEMNPDGSNVVQVTNMDGGISNFLYAPDLKHVSFTVAVKMKDDIHDLYPDLPEANARIMDDLMYRHWDKWDDYTNSHLFLAEYDDGRISDPQDIMVIEPFDTPLKPFGGREEIAWSPDGKSIAYTCKKRKGKEYAVSTNSDIYLYSLANKKTVNLTEGMPGYDKNPVFSPNGQMILWSSMERAGFESDRNRIFVMDIASKKKKDITYGFDYAANDPAWSSDGNMIYFISGTNATYQLFSLNVKSGLIDQITSGRHNITGFALVNDKEAIVSKMDMNRPVELHKAALQGGQLNAFTHVNDGIYKKIKTGKIEERWIETTDGKQMLTWVIYPPDFDPAKKYPALLYCQGGPQSAVSQFFSYRWNFQLMAANGYIIVAPNRRGLPSFGREWNDQISKDWGGQNMQDYLSAIDALKKENFVDENRLGCIGASYGGYSVYWLAGHHEKRFKTFLAHCGLFNLESWYLTTEEMFFANWDIGGPYWKPEFEKAYQGFSPHRFVQNWDTPIMVIHGQKDFRVPVEQGMGAFQAAQLQDIPSRFLYFPEEGHWVLSPQNGVLWHREFFRWLDAWLK
jgi:dipeptidyl aminopeptidase/acylaminoacyl peptidase